MRPYFFASLIFFICFSAFAQSEETITLPDAIKQKIVGVSGQYNESSVHYLRPVILTIISLINRPLRLKIEPGDLMEPQDSNCQTMLITGDTLISLKPGKPVTIEPYGMCTEPHDGAGRKGLKYFFTVNKNPKLTAIARYINTNKLNGYPGQAAVWCVAENNRSLLGINGYDSVSRLKLIKEVAAITGKKMPSAQELRQEHNTYIQTPKETIGGSFEFKFDKRKKVHIAMFNAQGTVVRELYYNPNQQPGVNKFNFEFDYTVYTEEFYDIKLIADDEVMLTSRIDRADDNWIEREEE